MFIRVLEAVYAASLFPDCRGNGWRRSISRPHSRRGDQQIDGKSCRPGRSLYLAGNKGNREIADNVLIIMRFYFLPPAICFRCFP